ncbi:MAG: helix-turn-helix transcriptional regulator [Firmicutes bacterium]|nr:helix-turn-helix transcriptional regulator [Bacillota bacterium]
MKDRLRELRKTLSMTQQEFGDRVSVKQNTIAQYEIGRSTIPDTVISLICREFNVNETWLRFGDGEMFIEKSPDHEIEAFMMDLLRGDEVFKRRMVGALARMTPDEWSLLEKKIKELQEP